MSESSLESRLQTKQALQCVAIASGKGGVGKTVFAVNLAVALSELGKRVLLVDSQEQAESWANLTHGLAFDLDIRGSNSLDDCTHRIAPKGG